MCGRDAAIWLLLLALCGCAAQQWQSTTATSSEALPKDQAAEQVVAARPPELVPNSSAPPVPAESAVPNLAPAPGAAPAMPQLWDAAPTAALKSPSDGHQEPQAAASPSPTPPPQLLPLPPVTDQPQAPASPSGPLHAPAYAGNNVPEPRHQVPAVAPVAYWAETMPQQEPTSRRDAGDRGPGAGEIVDDQTLDQVVDPEGARPELLPAPTPQSIAPLTLEDVLRSLELHYPLVAAALEDRRIASGEQLAARGAFDLQISGSSLNKPVGFYENYRQSLLLDQPLWGGSNVFAGYRIGRGQFEPWYRERVTNEGGAFLAGARVPLLQNRNIDARRSDVLQADYGIQLAEADIRFQLVQFRLAAARAYWNWVAAGYVHRINEGLFRLATNRVAFLQEQADAGAIAEIVVTDNNQLIVTRQAAVIEARQRLQNAAIILSLYFRDEVGNPIVATTDRLPPDLDRPQRYDWQQVQADVRFALENRPELRQLQWLQRQLQVELSQAQNLLLPAVDGLLNASQNVGAPVSVPDDKGPLVLEAGVMVDVPLQRRRAQGLIRATQARLAQLAAQRQFAENQVTADVQAAGTALVNAFQRYEQAIESVRLNEELLDAEEFRLLFERSDMLLVNLREQAAADAQILRLSAWLQYMLALAERHAALGLNGAVDQPPPAFNPDAEQ